MSSGPRVSAPPSGRAGPEWVLGRLDGVEAELAAVTEHALALVEDAVATQARLRNDAVRLVLAGCVGTVVVVAGLCTATLVLLL